LDVGMGYGEHGDEEMGIFIIILFLTTIRKG